jgi:transposase InsO family protein
VNRKRVQRIWREEGLRVPARAKKRRRLGVSTAPSDRLKAEHPNHVWALDFQHDATDDGRELKFLNVVDEFTREALAIEVDRSIDAEETVRVLERLAAERGAPANIRADNGPELTAAVLREWCGRGEIDTAYIEPGSPWQNPYVESFNARMRDELLNVEVFYLPGGGPNPGRRLARRLQRQPSPLGAWHDVARPIRCQLAANRRHERIYQPRTLIRGGPMNGVRSAARRRRLRCRAPRA